MTINHHPLQSLREGHWFKLICGASFQHLPAIRSLTIAYALAGADCIDVAADPAVITVSREAIAVAGELMAGVEDQLVWTKNRNRGLPWLMVSLNDGEDPHFRKAFFDPEACPSDCPRPCETICPAQAIVFDQMLEGQPDSFSGVVAQRCYGCGRCLPICPIQHIAAHSHVSTPTTLAPLVLPWVDAVEIHTQVGRYREFATLWQAIVPWVDRLKLVAVSCPDGEGLIDYLWSLYDLISPLPGALIWQTDGRPMSGDIGDGATRAAVRLGQKVLAARLPGSVQLAGGTNAHTVEKLATLGLLNPARRALIEDFPVEVSASAPTPYIAGVAYGSYARVLLSPVLEELEVRSRSDCALPSGHLEAFPDLLRQAVHLAETLVAPLKFPVQTHQPLLQ
ncbi:MAG: LdpA C-terminal domain-containing domain [Leptolyngbyaceae cyanobacterium bins.59]|nr:LdpA C-terminal domain-containing domain [Leptolyngbyaceae cyanobacterium bins.59]